MNKQKILILIVLPVMFLIGLLAIFSNPNYSQADVPSSKYQCTADGCSLPPNVTIVINAHGEAKKVSNNSGLEVFIPTALAEEWASFIIFYPVGLSVAEPSCDLPWGGQIDEGESITAYSSSSACSSCISETRVCTAGVLSGSYTYQTCTSGVCAACSLPWGGSISHGASVNAYNSDVNSDGCCIEPINRMCNDGNLTGDTDYNQGTCGGDLIIYNYNGSAWSAQCIEINGLNWLDRNLGATRVATAANDSQSYGDYFQWGRAADGHQWAYSTTDSGTTDTLSPTDKVSSPNTDKFIKTTSSPYDWRVPQNNNLWQGVNGINNPCPTGFRPPTSAEWQTLVSAENITNSATAYASSLKLPLAGYRSYNSAGIYNQGSNGYYWSSSPNGINAYLLSFNSTNVYPTYSLNRANGHSLRCVREITPPLYGQPGGRGGDPDVPGGGGPV